MKLNDCKDGMTVGFKRMDLRTGENPWNWTRQVGDPLMA